MQCRLIFDPPAAGAWNMAVDEVLLESAHKDGVATLRFYQWQEPTLSLGYFQAYSERERHAESITLPCVRRHSGGGALVHHHELTFSLALPAKAIPAGGPTELYTAAHEAVITALQERLPTEQDCVQLKLCAAPDKLPREQEPFLCFARRSEGDLLVVPPDRANTLNPDHKVCGSAQRKSRGAVLQHGGLLLKASSHAPELAGVAELLDLAVQPATISQRLSELLLTKLTLSPVQSGLSSAESHRAGQLSESRFDSSDWTHRR